MVERKATGAGRVTRPARAAATSGDALTPKEVFGMLRRHVLLIFMMTILGCGAGAGGWYLFRRFLPLYKAETIIKVLPPIETDPMTIVAAQVQKDIQYGHRVSMSNLIKQQSSLQRLLGSDVVQRTRWFDGMRGDIRRAVKYLRRNLTAYPHRDAEHIILSMACGDPREAADIVNEMTRLFVVSHGDTETEEVSKRLTELEDRRKWVEKEITAAEAGLAGIRRTTGITDLEVPAGRYFQHTITLRLNDLELQENELTLAIKQLQANIENLERLATGPITEQIEHAIENDPVMLNLAQQLAMQEAVLSGRLTKLGENHRVVRQTQELIQEIQERRGQRKEVIANQTRRANLANANDSQRVLEERLNELKKMRDEALKKQRDLDEARAQYDHWLKQRDERIEMLGEIKMQIEKLRIMLRDPETPKVQALGLAPEPLEMVMSRHYLFWIPGGTTLGFLLGLAFAVLVEVLNDLVRTPRDVSRFLNIPLLGVIPDAYEDRQARKVDLYHVFRSAPYSVVGESYRRFRINLDMSVSGESLRTLLIASGDAGDGKTSVAINLATAFVAGGAKVLLIDANFRRPSLQTLFPRSEGDNLDLERRELGLSNLLTGQCDLDDVIRSSGIEGLDVVDSGPMPANPSELLGSARMKQLLEKERKNYDHIVIDTPPVLLVSDAKVLVKLADSTLLVFNAAMTRRGAAQRTIFELRDVGANVIGCVLLGVQAIKGGYFHEQFKAYRRYLKPQLARSS